MCGVPRRFIGDGVSLFRDVAHFASTSGFPLCYPVLGPGQSVRSVSFATPGSAWASARVSLAGSIFFTPASRVPLRLTISSPPVSVCPAVFGRVAPFRLCCTFFMRRSWFATFDRTPLLPVSSFRVLRLPCLSFLSTRMTRRSSLLLTLLLLLPLRPTKPLREVLV